MENIYYMGHQMLGDSISICAAASIYSRQIEANVKVSFWEGFSPLVKYFDGVEYISPSNINLDLHKVIDTGHHPKHWSLENCVSRFYKYFTPDGQERNSYLIDQEIRLNTPPIPDSIQDSIGIIIHSNTNGDISQSFLDICRSRVERFYPGHKLRFIGGVDNDYKGYFNTENIIDDRTILNDLDYYIESVKRCKVVFGPVTGAMMIPLAMGIQVWCETPQNADLIWAFDFPNNRPLYFEGRYYKYYAKRL